MPPGLRLRGSSQQNTITVVNKGAVLCEKGLNSFQTIPCFYMYTSFENTLGKSEIARDEQFLLFPQCFQPIWRPICHFHPI